MHIQSPNASSMVKSLNPWMNNGPSTKPMPMRPTPKPVAHVASNPIGNITTKPFAVPSKGPAIVDASNGTQFKSPATLQTAGEPKLPNELSVATSDSSAEPISLEGLAKAWGSGNTDYDFTGDGVVNVQDLLYVMENWEQLRPPNSLQSAGDAQLMTAGETQLVTADGTALATESAVISTKEDMPSNAMEPADEAIVPDVEAPAPQAKPDVPGMTDEDVSEQPQIEIDPAPAPSTAESLNLRAYLDALRSTDSPRSAVDGLNGIAARAAIAPESVRSSASVRSMGGLKPLADSLFNHLSEAGFADQPPTNVRELVDALNLAPRQTDFLLKQLAMKYPAGLGVNVVG